MDEWNIAGTYNLIFNASLMVAEGVGYAPVSYTHLICLSFMKNTVF